ELHVITWTPEGDARETTIEGVHVHVLLRPRTWPWLPVSWARRVSHRLGELGQLDAVVVPEFGGQGVAYARDQRHGPLITHLHTSLAQLLTLRPGLTWRERHGLRTRISLRVERSQTLRSAALMAP